MKIRKICIVLLLMVSFLFATIQTASGISVGENTSFRANSINSTMNGNTNNNTNQASNNQYDATNLQNLQTVNSAVSEMKLLSDIITTSQYVQSPYSIFVTDEVDIPVSTLTQLTSLVFVPNGYNSEYYYIPKTTVTPYTTVSKGQNTYGQTANFTPTTSTTTTLSGDIYNALKKYLADDRNFIYFGLDNYSSDVLTTKELFDTSTYTQEQKDLLMTQQEKIDFDNKISVLKGYNSRTDIVNNETIIDFETYQNRYEALKYYLDSYSATDTVKTQYIIEIKTESISETTLWSQTVETWNNTPATHFWQFECIESPDNKYHQSLQQFGSDTVNQTFYYEGKYKVTATQAVNQSYYDVLSYSVNEYWIIAETGQVIWKSESKGSTLSANNNEPFSIKSVPQTINYKKVDEGTYYVTVYDETIDVVANSLTLTFAPTGVWGNNFTTERIK